ncbi:MAG: ABC transporter permease, partial [Candidatus Aenigmarchaeota archaeon]|nr:ABC transporter permease [Candidatus Aenigmarchaeota archaeon]
MRLSSIFRHALGMLFHSKLRSWLTIIGIVIGVAAVVSIISIGQGLQQNVNSRISGLGQDIITIRAGSSRAFGFGEGGGSAAKPLSSRELSAIRLVSGIKYITGIVSGRTSASFSGQTASLSVQGMDPSTFKDFVTFGIASGRYLGSGESGTIVIGNDVAMTVFKKPLQVGYVISINGRPFRIIGILQPSTGFGGENTIYMPLEDARNVLSNANLKDNEYSSIQSKVANADFISDISAEIEASLINIRHVRSDVKDFSVTTPSAFQQRLSDVTNSITLFLTAIAAVSLLVGGIGVANTMFTSVIEKTKEIGIMKAIGARNSDILLLFLINSGLLGLVGGLIGISLGAIISLFLPSLGISLGRLPGSNGGLTTVLDPGL